MLANKDRVTSVQAISGTGALRLAAEFVGKFMKGKPCYISNPTWGTHSIANSSQRTFGFDLSQFEIRFFLS